MASLTMSAQYVVSDKYDLWFEDTNNEMTTRKPEYCTDHYQDLRNGYSFLYSDDIFLLNNGTWKCIRGSYVTYVE